MTNVKKYCSNFLPLDLRLLQNHSIELAVNVIILKQINEHFRTIFKHPRTSFGTVEVQLSVLRKIFHILNKSYFYIPFLDYQILNKCLLRKKMTSE